MRVSLYIAKRYLFTKSSNNAINIITGIAGLGVVFAAAALIIVLSGFAGLKDFTLAFTAVTNPELTVLPSTGKQITLTNNIIKILDENPDITAYSKVVEERVFLRSGNLNNLAVLKGVDENYKAVIPIDSILFEGQWLASKTNQIVSGIALANTLSFGVFDFSKSLNVYVPKPGTGQVSSVKSAFNSQPVANVGLFDVNEDLNQNYIFGSLHLAQELLNYKPNQISAIELKLTPNAEADKVVTVLKEQLGNDFTFKTRQQLNSAIYKMLNTENLAVYLIFTLVLIIALFNIIGSIIMIVLDKKESAKTLFNLGMPVTHIRRIFFYQGSLMAILGGAIGLCLGLVIVVLQQQFSLIMLTPNLPYPVVITATNVVLVIITLGILGVLASRIATYRINTKLVQA